MKNYSPFDFVNQINSGKHDLIREADNPELVEKSYVPFIINKNLSFFVDTIYYANEMNQNWSLDKKLQNDYFLNTIRKGRRFSKWLKKASSDDLDLIQEYFGYSLKKAEMALSLLTKDQIAEIKQKMFKGG